VQYPNDFAQEDPGTSKLTNSGALVALACCRAFAGSITVMAKAKIAIPEEMLRVFVIIVELISPSSTVLAGRQQGAGERLPANCHHTASGPPE
jgi:hypothetical protein